MIRGLTLDSGALIAFERGDPRVRALLADALRRDAAIDVIPEVIAQTWRGGARQARLASLLAAEQVRTPAYDGTTARAVGMLCGVSGHADVVDVHVVLHAAAEGHAVVTSAPDDLRKVDPAVRLVEL